MVRTNLHSAPFIHPEIQRRESSSSSTSPSLLDEIHAQIIEADSSPDVQAPIPKKRSKSPSHLAVVAEATDDDDHNLDALGREIVEELEEDSGSNDHYYDDVGMSISIDDSDTANLTGPIKGEKVPEMRPAKPPKISSVEEAVAALTRAAI